MQKKIVAIAVTLLCTSALPALAQSANTSKVELWGIVDAAVRHTDNEGANRSGLTKMIGGGMSQGRWGIKVEEDLGGGSKAVAELENRFNTDDGTVSTPFFQLAYVGVQGPYGRLTMGRQWNVLFDVVTSTYASFPYSPYMEAYKPELGMAAGARSSNALKYTLATPDRKWVGTLQYAFGEGVKVNPAASYTALQNVGGNPLSPGWASHVASAASALKQAGGFLRYSANGLSVGGGYLSTKLPGGSKLNAWTFGGSYRFDKWYVNLGYGENKYKITQNPGMTSGLIGPQPMNVIVDLSILSNLWAGQSNGGFQPGAPGENADKRRMSKIGFGYQITPAINIGAHYFHAKQTGSASGAYNGKADFFVAAVDYAFSKRTDAYFAVDHTKLNGGAKMAIDNPATTGGVAVTKRTGITVGLRHRF